MYRLPVDSFGISNIHCVSTDGSVVVDDPSRPSFERFTKLILLVIFVD